MRNELFQKSCLMKTSPNNLRKSKSADFAGSVKILKNLLRENSSASYLITKLHTFLALISARTSFCGFRRKKLYNCVVPILHMRILFILFMKKKEPFPFKKEGNYYKCFRYQQYNTVYEKLKFSDYLAN